MKNQNNQLPQGWQEVELGELCEIKKGSSITKDKITDGNVPVIAGGQQPAYYHNASNRTGETLTVSGSGAYAGFVAYFNMPIFASDCSTIQEKLKNVFIRYVYYYLKGNQDRIYKLQKGIAQPHVYPKDLEKIKIPIPFSNGKPDLKEQERIVRILEKAETLKQKGKNVENLLDECLKSVFYEMFLKEKENFPKETLNNNCDRICVSYVGPCDKYYTTPDKGVPMIRTGNLKKNYLDLTDLKHVTKDFHEKNIKSQLHFGD